MRILDLLAAASVVAVVSTESQAQISFSPVGPRSSYDAGVRCASPWARVADLNRDGRPDIAVAAAPMTAFTANSSPGEIMLFQGQADGSFREATRQMFSGPVSRATLFTGIEVADLNGDGVPDLFTGDSGLDTYVNGVAVGPWLGATPVLALSSPSGFVDSSARFSGITPSFAHTTTVADIDRNGTLDIYVGSITNYDARRMPYLLLNDGRGNFTYDQSRLPAVVVQPSVVPVTTVDGTRYFSSQQWTGSLFADVNRDGAPDLLLFPIDTQARGLLLLNDGKGYFNRSDPIELPPGLYGQAQATFRPDPSGSGGVIGRTPGGTNALHAVAVDLNDDGFLDVVVLQTSGDRGNGDNYRGGKIQVLINQGGRGFVDESAARGSPGFDTTAGYDSYHAYLNVFDINQDGYLDLIATRVRGEGYSAHVFLNDGQGRFTRAAPAGLPERGVVVPLSAEGASAVRVAVLDFVYRGGISDRACDIQVQTYEGTNPSRGLSAADNTTGLWWNSAESGWGLSLTQQGTAIFGALFNYAPDGSPMWLVMSDGRRQPDGTFQGSLYRTTGPAFSASPFPPLGPGIGSVAAVGAMQVTFQNRSVAYVRYDVDGRAVTKRITPQVFSRAPACRSVGAQAGSRASRTNYTDLWWVPTESGWGVSVTHQGDTIFAALFTYAAGGGTNNPGLWMVMSSGTRQPDGSFRGDLYRISGPAFDANPFVPVGASNLTRVGAMQFRFDNGERGTLTYDYEGTSVTKQIVPQVFGASVPLCEG
jgi:hypothetical protein